MRRLLASSTSASSTGTPATSTQMASAVGGTTAQVEMASPSATGTAVSPQTVSSTSTTHGHSFTTAELLAEFPSASVGTKPELASPTKTATEFGTDGPADLSLSRSSGRHVPRGTSVELMAMFPSVTPPSAPSQLIAHPSIVQDPPCRPTTLPTHPLLEVPDPAAEENARHIENTPNDSEFAQKTALLFGVAASSPARS